jgi:hypothetical protein
VLCTLCFQLHFSRIVYSKKKGFGTHVLFRFLLYNKIGQKSLILN